MTVITCPKCFGEGLVGTAIRTTCQSCLGKGAIINKEDIKVTINHSDTGGESVPVNVGDRPWYKKWFENREGTHMEDNVQAPGVSAEETSTEEKPVESAAE